MKTILLWTLALLLGVSAFGQERGSTAGGGVSSFTALTGVPNIVTLTNDATVALTPLSTNVVGNTTNVTVQVWCAGPWHAAET